MGKGLKEAVNQASLKILEHQHPELVEAVRELISRGETPEEIARFARAKGAADLLALLIHNAADEIAKESSND